MLSLKLQFFSELFTSQEIDMGSFLMFNDSNLKELGVHAYGARHKMLLAIAGLNGTCKIHFQKLLIFIVSRIEEASLALAQRSTRC